MEVSWAGSLRVSEGHRKDVDMNMIVDAGVDPSLCGFAEGDLVRMTRSAKRSEGGEKAVMWADAQEAELLEVPWDSLGVITGGARYTDGPVPTDKGHLLLRILFPQGAGLWWPEYFERVGGHR